MHRHVVVPRLSGDHVGDVHRAAFEFAAGDTPVVAGRAEVLDAAGTERVRSVIGHKYRVAGRLLIWAHRMVEGADGSVGPAIGAR